MEHQVLQFLCCSLSDTESSLAISIQQLLGYDASYSVTSDVQATESDQVMYSWVFHNIDNRNINEHDLSKDT